MTIPVDLGQGDRLAGEDKHRMNQPLPVRQEERERIAAEVERVLFRRIVAERLEGYTLEASKEIADAILSASPTPVLMERGDGGSSRIGGETCAATRASPCTDQGEG